MATCIFWPLLALVTVIALAALPRRAPLGLHWFAIAMATIVIIAPAAGASENNIGAGVQPISWQEYDPGGDPVQAMLRVVQARKRGEEVPIRGVCYSSCALKLSAGPNLCVSPTAQIGVHEVRRVSRPNDYAGGMRDALWTGFYEGMIPACARNLFSARNGFASGWLVTASGTEILRACPTIRACSA